MNPKKLDTILSWPQPQKLKDLQSFLGFTNFYRQFINNYSCITLPLTALTKKSIAFNFSDECRDSFEELKCCFTSAPVLRHFDPRTPCYVSMDGSDFMLSRIIQQADENGDLHPISFFSRKFAPTEINYDVYDKELLAIVETFHEHWHWLLGSPFPISVICNHKNLVYFMTLQLLNRRQAWWRMFLSEFDFKLDWALGKLNVADAASRQPNFAPQTGDEHLTAQHQMLLKPENIERLISRQFKIPHSSSASTLSAVTTLSVNNTETLEHFKSVFKENDIWKEALATGNSNFTTTHGLVFHKGRLYIPPSLCREILFSRHDSLIGGHPGCR
uniref:Reverse transcriptase/retrotransposon-derived protein RNase H-like domain-containing protein n=1 Tax=Moniliophthora roreri TaxID=221103 RepID=A0A0W0FG48_MONRR